MTKRSVQALTKWDFKQARKDSATWRPVSQFPTNIHLDLLAHGMIPDPFVGKNELDVQWVGEEAWLYRTTFSADGYRAGGAAKAVLAFAGLDTHATVTLNGKHILKTDNMFIPERIDVTKTLKEKDNELAITFESTFLIGKKLVEKQPDHKWGCWNGDASRLAVRKAQYHYVSLHATPATRAS